MISQDNRDKKIQTLSDVFKTLYSSPDAGAVYSSVFHKYNLEQNLYRNYITIIGDTILGFHGSGEIPSLFQKELGVSADDAQKIVSDLSEFLSPVIARETSEKNIKREELYDLQQSLAAKQGQDPNQTTPTTKAGTNVAPVEKTEVQPMRTMEGDINRIHGYGAYRAQFPGQPQEATHTEEVIRKATQEDLLKEKPKLAEKPSYTEE